MAIYDNTANEHLRDPGKIREEISNKMAFLKMSAIEPNVHSNLEFLEKNVSKKGHECPGIKPLLFALETAFPEDLYKLRPIIAGLGINLR